MGLDESSSLDVGLTISRKEVVRVAALTLAVPGMGFLICFFMEAFLNLEFSKLICSVINLVVVSFFSFFLLPNILGIPFGKIKTRDFNKLIGFHLPNYAWKHILLGIILAVFTLTGMLIASIITANYVPDFSTVTLSHSVFSLNPGIWEELFFRGVLMIVLLRYTKSLRQAAIIQVALFGVAHIKGADIHALIEVVSVMIIGAGFTYTAYKTRTLVTGILFHYIHDALLFLVQLPSGTYTGFFDDVLYYALLWSMVGLGCLITKVATEKLEVRAPTELYTLESGLLVH
jgi:hypothetical protein